jgi:hypothetical protein
MSDLASLLFIRISMSIKTIYEYELSKVTRPEFLAQGGTQEEWDAMPDSIQLWETLTSLIGQRVRNLGFKLKVQAIGDYAKKTGTYTLKVPDLIEDNWIGRRLISLTYSTVLNKASLVGNDDDGSFMLTIPHIVEEDTRTYIKVSRA